MNKSNSLIAAYLLDNKGGGQSLKWSDIRAWQPGSGNLWIHLDYTKKAAQHWLSKESGLDKIIARSMYVQESRPRTVITEKGIFISLRGVNLNPGQDPEDMVSIRIWLEHDRIITVRHRRLLSICDLREAIHQGVGPTTPSEVFMELNHFLTNRIANVVSDVNDEVDSLEDAVMQAETRLLRPKISEIRREAILIKRYLSPQREALYQLQLANVAFLSVEQRSQLRETNDRVIRYIEDLDSTRERATIIQEELSSRITEQIDTRMYILSLIAAIFLPISFITSLLGINVAGIPGSEYKYSFEIVCGVLFVITLILLFLFRRKKWI